VAHKIYIKGKNGLIINATRKARAVETGSGPSGFLVGLIGPQL